MKLVSTFSFSPEQIQEMEAKGVQVNQLDSEQALIDSMEYADADIIIANHRTLQKDFLEQCKQVKWVQVAHIGIERLPMDYLQERGIIVINARGGMGVPISEDILCKMLMLSRKSATVMKNQFDCSWSKVGGFINLSGKTVGIIGTGDVGTETAKRAKAFGMKTIGINTDGRQLPEFDRIYKPEEINDVIARSDFNVLTLPLTDKTKNLIDEEQFKLMKPQSYLINISRGALINEDILLAYLKDNKIAGAALDVFVDEFKLGYLPKESAFWGLDNIIITPHCAGSGDGFKQRFSKVFLSNLDCFVEGKTEQMVNVREFGKGY
ncbi:NAD(P)-dependent oxidoreductase [Aquibacillus albus]|uniref:Phosphoglycerate dehydrogenase-like enzyme n=1 Tax=Aquibacillus albus TaxID=1168171 RepID=A0ABS2MWL5_9BACI|nr:NAD(P)-dependent oxidoreductase [Aquibacillus albus]MBM7570090.1 phosphoglycerate dehydrogenase-like enzyme [Aquibacillus albus]